MRISDWSSDVCSSDLKGVAKISFTGDHRTAQKIMQNGSVNLKRCTFECGGKSPHIVFADADLEKAVTVALHSAFRSTVQSCSCGSRLFLQRELSADFSNRLADRNKRIHVGVRKSTRQKSSNH